MLKLRLRRMVRNAGVVQERVYLAERAGEAVDGHPQRVRASPFDRSSRPSCCVGTRRAPSSATAIAIAAVYTRYGLARGAVRLRTSDGGHLVALQAFSGCVGLLAVLQDQTHELSASVGVERVVVQLVARDLQFAGVRPYEGEVGVSCGELDACPDRPGVEKRCCSCEGWARRLTDHIVVYSYKFLGVQRVLT